MPGSGPRQHRVLIVRTAPGNCVPFRDIGRWCFAAELLQQRWPSAEGNGSSPALAVSGAVSKRPVLKLLAQVGHRERDGFKVAHARFTATWSAASRVIVTTRESPERGADNQWQCSSLSHCLHCQR